MTEQKSNSEARSEHGHRSSLREAERRRLLRNRMLGGGAALALTFAGMVAAWRELPQWVELPTNSPTKADKQTASPLSARVSASGQRVTRGSEQIAPPMQAATVKPALMPVNTKSIATRANVPGPEILPVEEQAVPRRRRHRKRHSMQQIASQSSEKSAAKTEIKEPSSSNAAASSPAPPSNKPPDDVPDNP